jgi:hypothetical protein
MVRSTIEEVDDAPHHLWEDAEVLPYGRCGGLAGETVASSI